MKNVFLINSHTTFLSTLGVVDSLQLNADDIIFVYLRDYKNRFFKVDYKSFDISYLFYNYPPHDIWRNRRMQQSLLKEVDEFIEDSIGELYYLYAPHYSHPIFQMFYTHDFCQKGAYVQEGGVPFKDAYLVNPTIIERIKFWLINRLLVSSKRFQYPNSWYYKNRLYKQKSIDSYATSDAFFEYLPSNNHIIMWPRLELDINIQNERPFFIFDGFVKNRKIESDFYLQKCKKLIQREANISNYIKFHPAQSVEERNTILGFFNDNNSSYEIFSDDIPIELVIASCRGLKFIGFGSSLLFYARDFGHDVVCVDKWLADSPLYMKYKKRSGFCWFED